MKGLWLLILVSACSRSLEPPDVDAGSDYYFQLALTTRLGDYATTLGELSVYVDDEDHTFEGSGLVVVQESFADVEAASQRSHRVDIRLGDRVLHSSEISPGQVCNSDRGANNQLLSESVALCLRGNGEIQLNDFSCEYSRTGFFTADVYCPAECHPLFGAPCESGRCGLVYTNREPDLGRLVCVESAPLPVGAFCEPAPVGEADDCANGAACIEGRCQAFCLSEADCRSEESCEPALSQGTSPLVCRGGNPAPADRGLEL